MRSLVVVGLELLLRRNVRLRSAMLGKCRLMQERKDGVLIQVEISDIDRFVVPVGRGPRDASGVVCWLIDCMGGSDVLCSGRRHAHEHREQVSGRQAGSEC